MVDEMMLIHDMMIDDGWDGMMINEMILYKAETTGKGSSRRRAQAPSWNLSHIFLWTYLSKLSFHISKPKSLPRSGLV